MERFADLLNEASRASVERLLAHLPQWLEVLALLVIGWVLARVLRAMTRRGAQALDTLVQRTPFASGWHAGKTASVLGAIVYWVVLLFFVTAATQALGLETFTQWLARLLDHLPTLMAGVLIVAVGYLLSGMVAKLVLAATTPLTAVQRQALSRIAQGATLVVALLVGADQIGLKVTWLAIFAALLLASLMGGIALAASLGARHYVANLIGAHYLGQALHPGQMVRVGGHEGRIVAITATSLVLETPDGRVLLPARLYHDEAIVVVAHHSDA